jgi:hypothetical protein
MTTSGSINFSLNARQVVTAALKKLRVIAAGEDPTADQAADATEALNLMLKGWQKHTNLWRMTEGSVTLLASTYSYALSPVPHKVISARYRDANARDLPMYEMSRQEYYDLPVKTGTGIPTQFYVDEQRAAHTMYVWQALATVTTETIKYTFQRQFEDIDSLDNDLDLRPEHLELVTYALAARLVDDFGRSGEIYNRIIARADIMLQEALDDDRESEIRLVPAGNYGGYGSQTPY